MSKFTFKILAKDNKTGARAGKIKTGRGEIETPAFVPVGTQATVKSLDNQELERIGVQIFLVNTYHIYLRPGLSVIQKFGDLHRFMGWNKPLMTDSAGFQIFSLGEANRQRRLRFSVVEEEAPLVRISEEGVTFRSHLDGSEHIFTPEKSIEAQITLGADMMVAFDECTYYPSTQSYAKAAMQRTHRWARRCLVESEKLGKSQALYGVIQGGVYQNLREESAKFISSLCFAGIAIGGVAVGESKKEMVDVLDWVFPFLPEGKPRHLLGVGEIEDIFVLVGRGVDTFDCVMPTRLARMGFALRKNKAQRQEHKVEKEKYLIDLNKSRYALDEGSIEEGCQCLTCQNYSRGYLHHLFRAKELLAYRLVSYHNLYFMERLMKQIRNSLKEGRFSELRKEWL